MCISVPLKSNPESFVFSDLWIRYLTEAFRSKFLHYIFWFSKNVFPSFSLLTEVNNTLFIMLVKFFLLVDWFFHCAKIVSNILDEVILITLSRLRTIIFNSKINLCSFGGVHQSVNLLVQVRATAQSQFVLSWRVTFTCLSNYFLFTLEFIVTVSNFFPTSSLRKLQKSF